MKTVNVFVCIQMDINGNDDQVSEVHRILDLINTTIGMSELDSQPQILVNDVSDSEIVDLCDEIQQGDNVEVPDPNETDIHNHSFSGYVKFIKECGKIAVVEDGDGDCFDIEINRLTLE